MYHWFGRLGQGIWQKKHKVIIKMYEWPYSIVLNFDLKKKDSFLPNKLYSLRLKV